MKFGTTYSIVQGDFNAKIRCSIRLADSCVGKYGTGVPNTRGSRLITFVISNRLHIMNTFSKKSKRDSGLGEARMVPLRTKLIAC